MRYPDGFPGWVDLVTPDVDVCRPFYEGLFGWTSRDIPTPMGPVYTMFLRDGQQVAGMGPIPPGMEFPAVWNTYVIVADAEETIARAVAAGGAVAMPVMDVMEQGRMAMLADPSGASIGIWQPRQHQGADVLNVPGALTWNELQTRSLDRVLPFYSDTFGWNWVKMPQEMDYRVAELPAKAGDDKSVAGAMSMPDGIPDEVPDFWFVYFAVDDCEAALARAVELGGSVLFPAMSMGPGTFGGIIDPVGAQFAVGHFPSV